MLLYACISAHGFGHGARTCAIVKHLARDHPQVRIVLSSALPPWFLDGRLQGVPHQRRRVRWDVGAIQRDALTLDRGATGHALQTLEQDLPALIRQEAAWLARQEGPLLVYGDNPWAAVLLGEQLGCPVWLGGNFGWDDIYRPWGGWFEERAQAYGAIYRRAHGLLRMPLGLAMDWGLPEVSLGLVLSPAQPAAALARQRRSLALRTTREHTMLICFGGLALAVAQPAPQVRSGQWTVLDFGDSLPRCAAIRSLHPPWQPQQLMPLCGRVLTKPGFSTVCEAMGHGCGLILVERHGFAEAAALCRGVQQHGFHRLITSRQLQAGDWGLAEPLLPPRHGPLGKDGAQTASRHLAAVLMADAHGQGAEPEPGPGRDDPSPASLPGS